MPHHPGSRLPGTALDVQALAPRGSRLWGLELGAEPVGLRKERAVWCTLSAWRRCGAGRQKSEHRRDPPRPEDAARRMASWRGLFGLTFLCLLMRGRGQGDFDLADALDDPEPTKKPSSDIYPKPKPPYPPQPGHPGNSGDIYPRPKPPYPPRPGHPGNGGDVYPYPRPKPPVHPQPGSYDNSGGFLNDRDLNDGRYPPRPRPPAGGGGGGGGGGGYHPSHSGYGNPSGGGRYRPGSHGSNYGGGDYSTYGNPQGNTIAKIVSPIVSVVVVTLVGAAASYFQYNRRRNCFRTNEPQNV